MKYLIVEPHADDTLLSALYSLDGVITKDDSVYLLTITNSNTSGKYRDSLSFACLKGYKFIKDNNYIPQVYFKQGMKDLNGRDDWIHCYMNMPTKNYQCIAELIKDRIAKYIDKYKPDVLITCYGILHPTHVLTRHAVDSFGIKTLYYVDNPYFMLDQANELVSNQLMFYDHVEKVVLTEEQIKNKKQLFNSLYNCEFYMVYMYKDMLKLPEILCAETTTFEFDSKRIIDKHSEPVDNSVLEVANDNYLSIEGYAAQWHRMNSGYWGS